MRAEHVATLLAALSLAACDREDRRFSEFPPTADPQGVVSVSALQPGPTFIAANVRSPYDDNAYAISQGKRLFNQMNCVGCHSHGGGGMGPALMDDQWIYGSRPEQIFATIVEGRPNGMPSWRGRLSNQQVWQIVAYVRSLGGLTPDKAAQPGRDDALMGRQSEQNTKPGTPRMTNPSPPGAVAP